MLQVIRRNAGSWLLKIILGAIVVVFVFWGIGSFRSQRMSVIAKVNGEEIYAGQYQQAYSQAVERYSKMFGGRIPEGFLKNINIKQQVLDNLINEALIRQAAAKMGIRVSEDEVRNVILGFPNFKRNGVFDKRLYDMALREAHLTPLAFEGLIRQQLITDKLREILFSGIMVPEQEVKENYLFQNEKVNALFVKIPWTMCKESVNVTDAVLQSWYEDHKSNYETKPRIRIKYILFSEDDVLKGIKVSDDAIRSYYDAHKKDYEVKERRRARHILIRVPQDADNATIVEKRKRAEEVLKKAQQGEDFAELAKKYSEDPGSAKSGGDLGFFTRGMMVRPFEDKVFSMKEGEVQGPVRTRFGFHIVKLEKVEPGRTKSFEEVKGEIQKKLKEEKAKDILWETANKAYDEIIALGGLKAYANATNATLKETPLFSRSNPPPFIGFDQEVLGSLFSLEEGELSSLLQLPRAVMIAEMVEKRAPEIPPLKEVKTRVKNDYVKERSIGLCKDKAEALIEKAKTAGLEAAAKKMGFKVAETGFFKRSDLGAAKGIPRQAAKKAVGLFPGKPLLDEPVEVRGAFYVVAFKERRAPDLAALKKEGTKLKSMLLTQKRNTVFENWLTQERKKARIEIVRNP